MKIGEYIKEIRISKGFTQLELSEKTGIAVRAISSSIKINHLRTLLKMLLQCKNNIRCPLG